MDEVQGKTPDIFAFANRRQSIKEGCLELDKATLFSKCRNDELIKKALKSISLPIDQYIN